MGTYHFMGVGKSVGAVTCAIDYIEKALHNPSISEKLFSGTGGVNHKEENPGKIEALVFFTSKEVIERSTQFPAYAYEGVPSPGPVKDELKKVLKTVWKTSYPEQKIFWCEVNIDDYEDCFEKVVKAAYRFSPPNKQGKEIWCNLTSGSDSLGMALLTMSELTAKSTKRYLLSQRQDYRKYVNVPPQIKLSPNQDNYFRLLPFIKKAIDVFEFYEILLELESVRKPIKTSELFDRLRSRNLFTNLTLSEFIKTYLLKMYSLEYTELRNAKNEETKKGEYVTITKIGQHFLNQELEELNALLNFEDILSNPSEDIVAESKQWPWFHEDIL